MRTKTQRLPPLKDEQLDEEQEEIIKPFRDMGVDMAVSRTLVRNAAAMKAFRVWAGYVMLSENDLPAREREILALRAAWQVKSAYIWSHHLGFGRRAGLTDEEMELIKRPIEAGNWTEAEAALIAAADALIGDFFIPNDIWDVLAKHFSDKALIDAMFVVGHFGMLAMFLNSVGCPMDFGMKRFPDLKLDPELDMTA